MGVSKGSRQNVSCFAVKRAVRSRFPPRDVARQGVGPFGDVAEGVSERNDLRPSRVAEEGKLVKKSLDEVVKTIISENITIKEVKEASVGEVLAFSYSWSSGSRSGYAVMQGYDVVSVKPHYERVYSKTDVKSDVAVVELHSPVVLNQISYDLAGQAEQAHARVKNEFGKNVVQDEPDLVAREQQYWWKMANKVLKELIYATSDKITWFVN